MKLSKLLRTAACAALVGFAGNAIAAGDWVALDAAGGKTNITESEGD